MGMFDWVFIVCPECGGNIGFQSKAGECDLREYDEYDMPPEIAVDLKDEERRCDQCKARVKLRVQVITKVDVELL